MSNFDLKLDRWNKIATILIGVLGFAATFYVTFFVIIPGHLRDTAAQCFAHQQILKKTFMNEPNEETSDHKSTLKQICDISDEKAEGFLQSTKAEASALKDSKLRSEIEASKQINSETLLEKTIGFVSLGKADDYVDGNFRNLKTGEKALKHKDQLKQGTVLKARWSVNLRTSSNNTEGGENPSIAIIYDNECVKMEEDLPKDALRGSYWVEVSLSECKVPD